MNFEFLHAGDPRWDDFVNGVPHDFYHLSGYVRMSQKYDGGRAEAVLATEGQQYLFLPYLVRPIEMSHDAPGDQPLCDLSSPYGYPGPLLRGEQDFRRRSIEQWIETMRRRGVISAFLRTHPLLSPDGETLARYGDLVYRGDTITIDLELSLEEIWRQTRNDHRRNINRARRQGLSAIVEGDLAHLDDFMHVYQDTMNRVDASYYYYFPREYFVELKQVLGDGLSLCLVRDARQTVVAAGMFTECDRLMQFHLSGTRSEALKLQPSKLMLDEVRRWAKARGNRLMHLGGGNGASRDNPLFRFKAGFSHLSQPFHSWQLIFAPERYAELQSRRDALAERPRDTSFFPSYRA